MSDKYAHKRPRLSRECYRSDRLPKMRYTRVEAHTAAATMPGYRAYRCPHCGHWHVGRAATKERS